MSRSFSKAYGLAGFRVGFSVSSEDMANYLNRVRQPFNANSLALYAAEKALEEAVSFLEIMALSYCVMMT